MDRRNDIGGRILLLGAGLAGVSGIMAAAAASHGGEPRNLTAIAAICLAHGPALLALGLLTKDGLLRIAGLVLAAGTLVFVADLAAREWLEQGLFMGAAPLGGVAMIVGWVGVALAGAMGSPKKN